jgi:hypothetical protein
VSIAKVPWVGAAVAALTLSACDRALDTVGPLALGCCVAEKVNALDWER